MTDLFSVTRSASLRGVSFHVETVKETGGFRKIDHAFPNRDDHAIENLGQNADGFSVKGYLSDIDQFGNKIRQFRAALKAQEPANFYHPLIGEMFLIDITSWSIDANKDELGRIVINFNCIKVSPDWQLSPIVIQSGIARLEGIVDRLKLSLSAFLQLFLYIETSVQDIKLLFSHIDHIQSLYFEPTRNAYRETMRSAQPSQDNLINDLFDINQGLYSDSDNAFKLFDRLSAGGLSGVTGVSAIRTLQNKQVLALDVIQQFIAFKFLADVVLNHEYRDKNTAHCLRLKFSQRALYLQCIVSEQDFLSLHGFVSDISAIVGEQYQALTDSLKPVDYIELPSPSCSLAMAWDLYQDAAMADDLVLRNKAVNASFMPNRVEYLVQ